MKARSISRGTVVRMLAMTIPRRPSSSHGRLWLGDPDDTTKQWSVADPLDEENDNALYRLRYGWARDLPKEQQKDIHRALEMAQAWRHFSTYPLGITHVVKQLREVWKALREVHK